MPITLTTEELEEMEDKIMLLDALIQSGVDNWSFYEDAVALYETWKSEE